MRRVSVLTGCLMGVVGLVISAQGANVTWKGGIKDWNVDSHWNSESVPGSADSAYVKSGEAWITDSVPLVNDIRPTTGGAIRIKDGGVLNSNQAKIGANGGNGTLYIEDGGSYSHVGSGQNFEIGKQSGKTDYIIQTGGTATFKGARIELGDDGGTAGVYNISGGSLIGQCTTQYSLGDDSYGEMNISGTANVNFGNNKNICLGVLANTGSGRINISGGTTTFGYTTIMGYGNNASGRIDISGGQTYFGRDVITGYTGLSGGEGNSYFKVVGSGTSGDFIKVSRQFKLDRGISNTVEFVLDSGGIMTIQTATDYLGTDTTTGFFLDSDSTLILDTLGNIGASVGDKFILATGNEVSIAGASILDNSDIYDFELNVLNSYYDVTSGLNIKALELTITAVPEPATLALLGLGGLLFRKKRG